VTSFRRAAGIPHNLHQWEISRIIDRMLDQRETLDGILTRERRPKERVLDKNRRKEAAAWLRAAGTEERDAKAALGTAVHDLAASGKLPADVPDVLTMRYDGADVEVDGVEARKRLAQYLDWLDKSQAEVLLSERQAWNLTVGYAGSFDLIVRLKDGSLWMIDLKTGSGTYTEHLLQLLAYAMAEFVGADDIVDEEATTLLRSVSGMAVLHLKDDGWEFLALRPDAEAWTAFRGLVAFAMWTVAHPDLEHMTIGKRQGSAALPEMAAAVFAEHEHKWVKVEHTVGAYEHQCFGCGASKPIIPKGRLEIMQIEEAM
jgi:hypothetical protein